MAGSLCAVCSGVMVIKVVAPDPRDGALQLRTYVCAECGHSTRSGDVATPDHAGRLIQQHDRWSTCSRTSVNSRNGLLAALEPSDFALLHAHLQQLSLTAGATLQEQEAPVDRRALTAISADDFSCHRRRAGAAAAGSGGAQCGFRDFSICASRRRGVFGRNSFS
jgi:hypothetical protein